jgi:AmiR/NasT family two-component response regulator
MAARQLRIFCVEDNALLVMDLQTLIEDAGHVFVGSASRFVDLKAKFEKTGFDLALVDIDLADGRTGGDAAEWLHARGRPSIFITGQEQVARDYAHAVIGTIVKPIDETRLRTILESVATTL